MQISVYHAHTYHETGKAALRGDEWGSSKGHLAYEATRAYEVTLGSPVGS